MQRRQGQVRMKRRCGRVISEGQLGQHGEERGDKDGYVVQPTSTSAPHPSLVVMPSFSRPLAQSGPHPVSFQKTQQALPSLALP